MKKLVCVGGMIAAAFTLFADDPVTLTASDVYSSTQLGYSFWNAGNWSNGEAPSEAYDYLVDATTADNVMTLMTASDASNASESQRRIFAGNSLTLVGKADYRHGRVYLQWNHWQWPNYPFYFKSLVLKSWGGLEMSPSGVSRGVVLQGSMTIEGTEENPAYIVLSGSDNGPMQNEMTMMGDEMSAVRVSVRNAPLANADGTLKNYSALDFVGNTEGFAGVVTANSNVLIRAGGEYGLAGAEVRLLTDWSAVSAVSSGSETTPSICIVKAMAPGATLIWQPTLCLSMTELDLCEGAVIDLSNLATEGAASGFEVLTTYEQMGVVKVDLKGMNLSASKEKAAILSLAATAEGTLDAGNFELVNVPEEANLELAVEDNTLYLYNNNYEPTTGYVTLETDDSTSPWESDLSKLSFYLTTNIVNWSDNSFPTTDKDYCVGAGHTLAMFAINAAANEADYSQGVNPAAWWGHIPFYGKSLTIAGTANLHTGGYTSESGAQGHSFKISDFRLASNGKLTGSFYFYGNKRILGGTAYFDYAKQGCQMTVLARATKPFTIEGGSSASAIIFCSKLIGADSTGLLLTGSSFYVAGDEAGISPIEFAGDNSECLGTISVGTNIILKVSSSLAKATVKLLDATYSHLIVTNKSSATLSIGKLVTPGAMDIPVAEGVSLNLGESELGGTLNIVCANYQDGQVNVGARRSSAGVSVNGMEAQILANGAVVLNGIEGSGTKEDPYIVDSLGTVNLLFGGDAAAELAKGHYYLFGSAVMPQEANAPTVICRVPPSTVLDFSKFSFAEEVPFDQYKLTTWTDGDQAVIGIKDLILPDLPSENNVQRTAFTAYSATNTLYYLFQGDRTDAASSYTGVNGCWKLGSNLWATNSIAPVAGYDHAVISEMYGPSQSYTTYLTLFDGDLGVFAGKSLTMCYNAAFRILGSTTIQVEDLRLQHNASTFNWVGTKTDLIVKGTVTILAEKELPFRVDSHTIAGYAFTLDFQATVQGAANRGITMRVQPNGSWKPGSIRTVFSGDATRYYGTVDTGTNGTVVINNALGLPNASVVVGETGTGCEVTAEAAATAAVPLKSLTMAADKTLKLAGKGLNVTGACTLGATLNLDLTGVTLVDGENVVMTAPEGTSLNTTAYTVTGLPANATFQAKGNTLLVTVGAVKKQGALIILK